MAKIQDRIKERFLNQQYNESELISFLQENKYTDIEVAELSPPEREKNIKSMKRFYLKLYDQNRTLFIGLDDAGKIFVYQWVETRMPTYPSASNATVIGCLFGALVVIGLVVWALFSMISGFGELDSEDDCNDSFIEEDYNGDGEKDAEDFRIQTEGC
ncbi:hypothetical protein [Cytobacillus firmus]|uniref:hypothetical protein n=1 Tax=Cytobacillus firmus TaxID=1399 RepID=UPI001C8ECE34|nr:hypothetical protein [Cytobacillus firmus]MBX9972550.1 hypothetical protein [Cytobacillus firmus]